MFVEILFSFFDFVSVDKAGVSEFAIGKSVNYRSPNGECKDVVYDSTNESSGSSDDDNEKDVKV